MKKIFLAVVALAAMTACSNDEFVSIDRAPINFGEAFVDNATRAADLTYGETALESFNVYGTVTGNAGTVLLFDGDDVQGEVGKEWSYVDEDTKEEYWIVDAAYNFAAVVDATATPADAMPTTLNPIADANMNLKDMLYASESVAKAIANQGTINFTFEHLLSKVQFTVTSNTTGDYSHSITDISVKNFSDADYTIAGGTWSTFNPDATATPDKNVEFGDITGVTAASTHMEGTDKKAGLTNATQMLLIPTDDDFTVSFTVNVLKNGTTVSSTPKTVTVTNPLVKGHAYNFTIDCQSNSAIKFSVNNNPTGWANGGGDGFTVQ